MKIQAVIRSAALFMAVIFVLVPVLSGCGNSGDNTAPETTAWTAETEETTSAPTEAVLVSKEGSDYMIIRSSYADTYEITAAKNLNLKLRDLFGKAWDMKISDDFVVGTKKDEIIENDEREILVGLTNRRESHDVYDTLGDDEYVIRFVNDKLVIIGKDEYATLAGVTFFIDHYLNSLADPSVLKIDLDIDEKGVSEKRKIPLADGAQIRLLSWNLGCAVGKAVDVVDVIMKYLPDIVSLQESNAEIHTQVIGQLIKNFDGYAYAKKYHANNKTVIYTPIVYNTKLMSLLEADVEWLDGRYTGTNTKSLAWAVFEDNSGRRFALIDFHGAVCSADYSGYEKMTSAQRNEIAAAWRLDNVRQVLGVKDRIISAYGDIPVMVNGDCNFNEDSQPYANMIAAGFADSEKTARKVLKTGYKTSYSYGSIPGTGKSIDHIFGLNGPSFITFDIIREDQVFTGSDHCPIYVDLTLPG